jgi:hypothetical protein
MKRLLTFATVLLAFFSSQGYAQWVQTNGPYGGEIQAFAASGTNLFAGTNCGLFLTTNNGTSWTAVNTGLTGACVFSLAVSGTNLFAGNAGSGVFLSTNNGTSWTAVNTGLTNKSVGPLAISGTNLFAGTFGGGVFLSNNSGISWTAVNTGLTNTYVFALAVSGTNVFAVTYGGVFLSTNSGTSWTAVNTGLTGTGVLALAVSGTDVFAGTGGSGVWRRPLSEMITSIEQTSAQLPEKFVLYQNYPNSFNPSTTIEFSLPHSSYVTLKVFSLLGKEVATLACQNFTAGSYKVDWNAKSVASGVYLYRLVAGSFVGTKKMLLLK